MTDKVTDIRPPFFMVEDAVVEHYDLTPDEGWLYIVILKHANRKTGEAFPSVQTLAKEAHMSKATVLRTIPKLEAKGLIRVAREENAVGKRRPVNHYWILSASRYLTDTDPGISQTPTPVSTGYQNQSQLEPEKNIAGEPAAVDSKPEKTKKQREPNPIFDAVALGSFGIREVNGDKTLGARIGKIVSWLKGQEDVTAEQVGKFYRWYGEQNQKASAPRDVGKFAEWWAKFISAGTGEDEIEYFPPTMEFIGGKPW